MIGVTAGLPTGVNAFNRVSPGGNAEAVGLELPSAKALRGCEEGIVSGGRSTGEGLEAVVPNTDPDRWRAWAALW